MGLKNIVLGIAIIILTISVAIYGINLVYESPEYSDFCEETKRAEIINTQEQCEAIGGQWSAYDGPRRVGGDVEVLDGYCDRDFTCRKEYEDAREKYSRTVFLIALPLGIILLAIGAFVFGLESVGAGLMGGGVGVILYGVGGFWRFADDWLKFVLSLIGLVVMIWFAYWFNSNNWNIWKKKKKK